MCRAAYSDPYLPPLHVHAVSCGVDPTARVNPVVGLRRVKAGDGVESERRPCERRSYSLGVPRPAAYSLLGLACFFRADVDTRWMKGWSVL